MFIRSFIKKNFSLATQDRFKIILSFCRLWYTRLVSGVKFYLKPNKNLKPRILFYCLDGLFYAGTQKHLQILAKFLNKNKFEVYFMFSSKRHKERFSFLEEENIKLIDFNFSSIQQKFSFKVSKMNPNIFNVIKKEKIDLVVATGTGYPEFPIANLVGLPIIFINIFGSINIQKNIKKHICVSNLIRDTVSKCITNKKTELMYVPSEGPTINSIKEGRALRLKLKLNESDFVFGRIGRPDDNIFDPIGINAFKNIIKKYLNCYYLIVAPPPILKKIVEEEKIPNVIFLPPISKEDEIWAFHQSLDALAHFRKDGETCGLNIAESMLCGKPIISHKSPIWNAHLEYLDDSFSRVVEISDVEKYAKAMEEFIEFKKNGKILEMGKKAKEKADNLFLIQNNIGKFEQWVDEVLK